jgi:hypothetical protein
MSGLIRLALGLVEAGAVARSRRVVTQMACLAIVTAVTAVCGIATVACVLTALWIYAIPHVGAVGAPLIVAGVLFVACLAGIALMRHAMKPRPAQPTAGVTIEVLQAEATRLFKEHKGTVLVAALVAGLLAGRDER